MGNKIKNLFKKLTPPKASQVAEPAKGSPLQERKATLHEPRKEQKQTIKGWGFLNRLDRLFFQNIRNLFLPKQNLSKQKQDLVELNDLTPAGRAGIDLQEVRRAQEAKKIEDSTPHSSGERIFKECFKKIRNAKPFSNDKSAEANFDNVRESVLDPIQCTKDKLTSLAHYYAKGYGIRKDETFAGVLGNAAANYNEFILELVVIEKSERSSEAYIEPGGLGGLSVLDFTDEDLKKLEAKIKQLPGSENDLKTPRGRAKAKLEELKDLVEFAKRLEERGDPISAINKAVFKKMNDYKKSATNSL